MDAVRLVDPTWLPGQPSVTYYSTLTTLRVAGPNLLDSLRCFSALPHRRKTSHYGAKGGDTHMQKKLPKCRRPAPLHAGDSHAALDWVTGAAVTTQGISTETPPPLFTGSQPQLNSGAGGPVAGHREQATGRLSHLLVT